MTSSFKNLIPATVLVLASATAFSALAQTPAAPGAPASGARSHGHGKGMRAIDVNKDNQISRDEAKGKPRLTKNFGAIDTNKDGQLSRDEMMAYRKAHKGEHKGEGKGRPKS